MNNTRYSYNKGSWYTADSNEMSSCQANMKSYNSHILQLENRRMGRRIINTKSTGSSLTNDDKIKKRMKSHFGKVNKGIRAFSQPENTRQESRKIQEQIQCSFPLTPYYGIGPTIIAISNLHIELNPALKNEDLISLELMIQGRNHKIYRTAGIPYGVLKKI